jgi:EAL domain-containing protein (putative c-di-GMP-specific phosphodiesterase class I)
VKYAHHRLPGPDITMHYQPVAELSADTRFAFQPLVNLHTGGVVAMEMLARPAHGDVHSLLCSAARTGQLQQLDVTLAVAAARYSSQHETLLPLHLNLTADTVAAAAQTLTPLHHALHGTGRLARHTVLEINPAHAALELKLFLPGIRQLRQLGYRIALDGVGAGNYPLTVIADARPDLIKMDREIIAGLPHESGCVAILEALLALAVRIGAQLVAERVERPEQVTTLRHYGIGVAQGNLLAPPHRRPSTYLAMSEIPQCHASTCPAPTPTPPRVRITDFMHPAVTLPLSATGDEVRAILSDRPTVSGVVLLDDDGKPRCTLDRNRFLLAVSGAYGHALYAQREAARLGDQPRVLTSCSSVLAALELVRSSAAHRRYDDIVVVDSDGRCAGTVGVGDVIHGVAQMNLDWAGERKAAGRPTADQAKTVHKQAAAAVVPDRPQ